MNKLLTVYQVAELLAVHPNTVREWTNKGLLRCCRIGTRKDRRFDICDVEEFINRSKD